MWSEAVMAARAGVVMVSGQDAWKDRLGSCGNFAMLGGGHRFHTLCL